RREAGLRRHRLGRPLLRRRGSAADLPRGSGGRHAAPRPGPARRGRGRRRVALLARRRLDAGPGGLPRRRRLPPRTRSQRALVATDRARGLIPGLRPAASRGEGPVVRNRAVVSVVGRDQKGVVARVSTYLASCNINIEDIEQRVMEGLFIMTMLVDLSDVTLTLDELVLGLRKIGEELSMEVKVRLAGGPSERKR